ncbi:hypothetical protein Ark11_1487 [Candidatus Ichthyocystis hellenicum]|uniref:Uncharacterized protein n=1 Tax=Candidatus Ichthyocystis hellenicum TaxID=1561003 RepID=A0A0S4M7N6_9BURK|nr:hypothetical protein Ark11_1487 [Candidatus Ichthyocystis hellenicum]
MYIKNVNYIDPNSKNAKFSYRKDKLLHKFKELIIDIIYNLSNSIIYEIQRLDQNSIVSALLSDIHGILISKSSIKSLILLLGYNKHKLDKNNDHDMYVDNI